MSFSNACDRTTARIRIICGLAVVLSASLCRAEEPRLTFEKDIVPIFEVRCFKCHGADQRKGSLDLRRRFATLKGGDNGAAIEPGKPDESLLVELLKEGTMPPKEEGRLDEKQIDLIVRWIAGGALTAAETEAPLEIVEVESQVPEEARQFWAFQPPQRPEIPAVQGQDRVRTPVDAFLLAKLEPLGLTFNPDAAKPVLLRRLVFDLHGLPPTPEQLAEFLADDQPGAYERLVDRLLAAPQYGERWGRHWLDVAGYADSDGYLEADRERPEAWRYRDYVIRAMNDDKPYDRFLMEQLAGDEIVEWRQAPELTPEMTDALVATGFLRTAADPTNPGYKEKLECYKVMADTTQIVSSAILGVTLQCARCHGHKLDPFPQRDYYKLHAIFLPSYDPGKWVSSPERAVPLATEAETAQITQENSLIDQRLAALNQQLNDVTVKYRDKYLEVKLAAIPAELKAPVKEAVLVPGDKRNDAQKKLIADHVPTLMLTDEAIGAMYPEFLQRATPLRAAIAAENGLRRSVPQIRGLMDLYPEPSPAHVLRRGDFNNFGQQVEPGVPEVLTPVGFKLTPQPGYKTTGRRKAFAEWVVQPQHPLTARVHVNRIWAHHFGRGIVGTLDDFGNIGDRPSHPELLDWLATEFIARGWSQKELHRLILNSTAFRQTATWTETQKAADPTNRHLSAFSPQRHEGEVLRDSMLAVAGKLNPQMFGVPVPVHRQGDGQVTTADDANGNRRSVYLQVRRSQTVTLLELFDMPKMEINCARRTEGIVAPQALTLLNSRFTATAAQGFSARILATGTDEAQRLATAYRLAFCREPLPAESEAIAAFVEGVVQAQLGEGRATATADAVQVARNAAWPHLCEALFNSNEFLFVE